MVGNLDSGKRLIYCCTCMKKVQARLTNGKETYPRSPALGLLPFWKCDTCNCFVGCHHKTDTPTKPLGCIPSPELTKARKHIHALLDPIWQNGLIARKRLYAELSKKIGKQYHTAEIQSIEEAREIWRKIVEVKREIQMKANQVGKGCVNDGSLS